MPQTLSTDNVTGFAFAISAVHRPTSRDEVVALVNDARARKAALYPVSTGLNWGYGSRSPAAPGCELVDLSAMNRILHQDRISAAHPVAVIEPGVTQLQLHDFLRDRHPGLTFNVTGSSQDTSIIGNALDRGVGYQGPRKEDVFGLEVVTGAGTVVQTGFRRLGEDSPLAHDHPYGLGPMLDGLFFQSNFGIVTSACFRLLPRRPISMTVSLSLRAGVGLANFIDVLGALKRDGLLVSVTHVGNRARTRSTVTPGLLAYLQHECGLDPDTAAREAATILDTQFSASWTSLGSVAGNRIQVWAMLREIRQRTKAVATMRTLTEASLNRMWRVVHVLRGVPALRRTAALLSAIRPLQSLPSGTPSDVAINVLLQRVSRGTTPRSAAELDSTDCGLLFINPALPSDGRYVHQLVQELEAIAERHNSQLYMTINFETASSMVAVINLLFSRASVSETAQAHACAGALLAHLHARGLEVYRARADMMPALAARDPAYWKLISSIKAVFDPDGIIAPGRYCALPD